jgi:hypothetical protein
VRTVIQPQSDQEPAVACSVEAVELAYKDTGKVLLRWKVSDKEYRVIFGDLHTETVSPERLAQLEEAMLK